MPFEIIDFHTHPFLDDTSNICIYQQNCRLTTDGIKDEMHALGISRIAGSVIRMEKNTGVSDWQRLSQWNEDALRLRERLGDLYIPGFHVHPDFVTESIREIRRMKSEGVCLVGELVPYLSGWSDLTSAGFDAILDEAEQCGMVLSLHTDANAEMMDEMVRRHKNLTIVAAHPGEKPSFLSHLARARISDNYYLDISGTGIFRHGVLLTAVKEMGANRVLFGTDYPICAPAAYVGGVKDDPFLTDEEKALVFAGNAKRLLAL